MSSFRSEKYDKTRLAKEKIPRGENKQNSKDSRRTNRLNQVAEKQSDDYLESIFEAELYTSSDTKNRRQRMKNASQLNETIRDDSRTATEERLSTEPFNPKKNNYYRWLITLLLMLLFLAGYFIYYQMNYVYVPNLEGKALLEVKEWTKQNQVKLKVEPKYSFDYAPDIVFKQSTREKRIRKGQTLSVNTSLGANPEEKITLPDFTTMNLKQAKAWITKEKAENIMIVEEYSETVDLGKYLNFEMIDEDHSIEEYTRKDKAKLYFSKGKEVFEKNIRLMDFVGKSKETAVEWAEKNEIDLVIDEATSDRIGNGKIIAQSPSQAEKIAKQSSLKITVSIGRDVIVPDFSQVTFEELEMDQSEFPVKIKQVYNDSVDYGQFISQSIETGTVFQEEEKKPDIQVVYSLGKPYMRDLRNNTLEGELQKIFYDEYQSRGANVTYEIFYVESEATKGTVVEMSSYNEFIPTVCIVNIGVSNGKVEK